MALSGVFSGVFSGGGIQKSQIQDMIDVAIGSNESAKLFIDIELLANTSTDFNAYTYKNISIPTKTAIYEVITENAIPDVDGDEMHSITRLISTKDSDNIIVNPVEYVIKTSNGTTQYPNVTTIHIKNVVVDSSGNALNMQIANLFAFAVKCRFFLI